MRTWIGCIALLAGLAFLAPSVSASGDADAGKSLFKKNCATCHGVHGDGKGPAAGGLIPPPANFTDPKVKAVQDDELVRIVQNGIKGGAMMGWKDKLTEPQIRDIVSYIRTF